MITIEKGMLVGIKDIDEAGIWRGLTGFVRRVTGPNIWVTVMMTRNRRNYHIAAGPFTAQLLELPAQMTLTQISDQEVAQLTGGTTT